MEIVINIPESVYKEICSGNFDTDGYFKRNLRDAFRNGTVLPKGHERLIEDKFNVGHIFDEGGNRVGYQYVTQEDINNAPTIIEADKE